MKKLKSNTCLAFCLLLIIVLSGCSTQKDRFVNRAYHTINAKYNGYFNARESYQQGLKQLEDAHQDNYERILDIFKYATADDLGSIASNMEIAYQKSSVVIQRHSMNIRGVEHNPMIDDAYFLIARSHFFRQDYNLAILTFEYIIRQYDTPLKYDSKIWIAKTNNEMGRFENALQTLEILQRNYDEGTLPEDYKKLFYLVYADHFYKQNKYREAIPYMEKAIEETSRRRDRTRLVFILGQTYHEIGDYASAQRAYSRVLRLNPDFDMEFRARINMAMAYDPKTGGGTQIKEQLNRMLRQERNREYRDQIYYALAKLSENIGLEEEAIEYYIKSTQVSESNNIQKGLSFLRLGQIHFDDEKYYKAHIYYDSTVTFLPNNYDDIDNIVNKRNILHDLALNINIINNQDSLQRVASLPQAERNRIIDGIIAREREQEREQREREREMMMAGRTDRRDEFSRMMDDGQGGWYFYNPSAMRFGQTEFASRWGDRKLEDLWRISNKQIYVFGGDMMMDDMAEFDDGDGFDDSQSDKFNRDTYLRNLPLLPEQLEQSNEKIIQALYNNGLIYKDRLRNETKAVEAFESLISRYPDNQHSLYTYYFLHDLYSKSNNTVKADNYKNRIINEFPDTDFAKLLSDPDYAKNLIEKQNRGNQIYKLSYFAFINNDFDLAIEYCKQADTIDISRELTGKFVYLKALSYAAKGNNEELEEALNKIVDNYNDVDVYEPAKYMLAFLGDKDVMLLAEDQLTEVIDEKEQSKDQLRVLGSKDLSAKYVYNPEEIHFFVFVVNTEKIQIRQLRNIINNFNREEFPETNLTVSNVYFDDKKQILTITSFENKNKAADFVKKLSNNEKIQEYSENVLLPFTISVRNYPEFFRDKDLKGYLDFYNYYYNR